MPHVDRNQMRTHVNRRVQDVLHGGQSAAVRQEHGALQDTPNCALTTFGRRTLPRRIMERLVCRHVDVPRRPRHVPQRPFRLDAGEGAASVAADYGLSEAEVEHAVADERAAWAWSSLCVRVKNSKPKLLFEHVEVAVTVEQGVAVHDAECGNQTVDRLPHGAPARAKLAEIGRSGKGEPYAPSGEHF
jgi:hypothetical protein